ncbi:hypothetical protein GCM10027270_08960 [Nocardioides ginkgobilobae]
MRSYVGAHGAPIAAVVLATGVALSGCSAEEDPAQGASASAVPSSAALDPREEEEPEDTFADVEEPASRALDADLLDGVAAMSVWQGAELEEDSRLAVAEITVAQRPVVVSVLTQTGLTARESAQAEMRYWIKRNNTTEGPVEVLDPVVVDGAELQRVRGATIADLVVDRFFYATGEVSVDVQFLTPTELSEAEREDYIGQVMATLEFE